MISSRLILGVNANPSPSSSPLQQRGEATRIAGRRGACPTICFDRVLAASHQLPLRRARRSRPTNSAFAVSLYCTVTSVPTGISEKNLRAVSAGNRMQPCDAG